MAILQRYSDVMQLTEKKEHCKTDSEIGIKIKDGAFGWKSENKPTISNINLVVGKGELAIVIGTVGSGKTTLLYSLMHETIKI